MQLKKELKELEELEKLKKGLEKLEELKELEELEDNLCKSAVKIILCPLWYKQKS